MRKAQSVTTFLSAATATGPSSSVTYGVSAINQQDGIGIFTSTYTVAGGTPSAVVNLEGSVDGVNWVVITTLTHSAAGTLGYVLSNTPYPFVRANVTTLGGTTPTLTFSGSF